MSQRSIRRAQQRAAASDERRATLRRRRATLATAAALGTGALLAPSAPAATLEVNNNRDGAANACGTSCKLRDAIVVANANGEADTITFASGFRGTITLTHGVLSIDGPHDLTIEGPGAGKLTVSGGGVSRVLEVVREHATIAGLTVRGGAADRGAGVLVRDDAVATIADAAITDNHGGSSSGGIWARGPLTVERTKVSGNTAPIGGGIYFGDSGYSAPEALKVTDSEISGNSGGGIVAGGRAIVAGSTVSNNSGGAGIFAVKALTVSESTISGNSGPAGAGIRMGAGTRRYGPLHVSDSRITGNHAETVGGGIEFEGTSYGGATTIERTTISGNTAGVAGGGMHVGVVGPNDRIKISHSTISGNDATVGDEPGRGGGLAVHGPVLGRLDLLDSTVSGNTADVGGGVSLGEDSERYRSRFVADTVAFRNSTIASNSALLQGGGIFLDAYDVGSQSAEKVSPTIELRSTIVADNTAEDLDRADVSTSGGFHAAFSLVERPSADAALRQGAAPNIVGADPQLGPLADNGGPTLTHLPARTSPAIDGGHGDPRDTDQRGRARVVDNDPPNPPRGDGTDIGAVELGRPATTPLPPAAGDLPPQAVIRRNGLRSKRASKRFVSGIARDDRAVAAVEVALVRKRGGKCRHLLASGRFSRASRCGGPKSFLNAQGTTKWRFDLKQRLDRGYYVVYSRAIDDAGQTQLSFGTKSRRPFRVR